jgi:ABC-2 type transport system ATP-binding protein
VQETAATEAGQDVCSYQVGSRSEVRERLVAAAVSAGAGVLQIVRAERELESVFLRLAGESTRRAAGNEATAAVAANG